MGVITSLLRPAFLVAPARPVLHYGGKDTVVGLGTETTTSMSDFLKNCVPSLFKDYTPAWWLPTGHLQTFYCVSGDFTKHDKVVYERKLLRLTDGGTIGLDWTVGHDKLAEDTAILVVKHGLTGGSYESYVRSVVSRVCKPVSEGGLGLRAVVCNFRGCAGVPITSPQFYSAGHTDDLRTALSFIRTTYPKAPLIGIGFSLGASVTTHYVGQEGIHSRLSGAIVLGCPWDLAANSTSLEGRFLNREIYSKAMASNLMRMFRKHAHSFRSLPDSPQKQNLIDRGILDRVEDPRSARGMRLIDVDHILTANLGGSPRPHGPFPLKDAADYYAWGSCPKRLVDVRVPLLAINAKDDPIVHRNPIDCGSNPYVALAITKQGGHLGWFKDDGTRWVVQPAVEFISAIARSGVKPSSNEHAIRTEPDNEGFIREHAPEREHLGWRLLKDGEVVVADVDEGVGLVAGL